MCPAVIHGALLYRDDSHVTNTAMEALTPNVIRQLNAFRLAPRHARRVVRG
jgi:hypothetical protein